MSSGVDRAWDRLLVVWRVLLRSRAGTLASVLAAAAGIAASDSATASNSVQPSRDKFPAGRTNAPVHPLAIGAEVPALRTRNSRTFTSPQGGRVARVYASAVNYRDQHGGWQSIDNNLRRSGAVFRNRANQYRAALPADLSKGPIRVEEGDDWVAFHLRGARGRGIAKGDALSFADAVKGVDVRYESRSDSLKESLVLAGPRSQRRFVFDLSMSRGMRPHLRKGGDVALVDRHHKVRMALAAPSMDDAEGTHSAAIRYGLQRIDHRWRLTLAPHGSWLRQSKRAWPVTIDPQVVPAATGDCTLSSNQANVSLCADPTLQVGNPLTGISPTDPPQRRAIVKFDVAGAVPAGADVQAAAVNLFFASETKPSAQAVGAYRITRANSNAATWNTADGVTPWTTPGGDIAGTVDCDPCPVLGGSGAQPGSFVALGVRRMVDDWSKGITPNYGMLLATSFNNMFTFASEESTNTSQRPRLDVRYDPHVGAQPGWKLETQQLSDRLTLGVNSQSGNLLLRQRDFTVPGGLGPDLTFSRSYNSLDDGTYAFGRGFGMDTGADVRLEDRLNDGVIFSGPSGLRARFAPLTATTYSTPPGFDADLVKDATAGTWTYTEHKSQRKLSFNSSGRLTQDTDRNGRKVTYQYDTSQRLSTITDSQNRLTKFFYDNSNRVNKVTDSGNRNYLYAYNGSGQLTSYTDPAGGVTKLDWTSSKPTLITTPAGRKTKLVYYPAGDPAAGRVQNVIRVTNPTAAFASMSGPTTTFAYTLARNGAGTGVVTDPNSHNTTTTYNSDGRPLSATDADGVKASSTYTSNANVQTYTAPGVGAGTTTTTDLTYDEDNNLTGTVTPTAPGGAAADQLATTVKNGALGGVGATVLGGRYLPGKVTNERGKDTVLQYDNNGNPKVISSGLGASVSLNYDAAAPGKLTSTVEPNGQPTSYTYDSSGNLQQITPPLPLGPTVLSYTTNISRVATVKDGNLKLRTLSYDGQDRLKKIAYADGTSVQFNYDPDGNVTSRLDTVGGNSSYTYDEVGRLATETLPSGVSLTFLYDAAGNLLNDFHGVNYTYTAANRNSRLLDQTINWVTFIDHDAAGRTTGLGYPNNVNVDKEYDEAGRVVRIHSTASSPSRDIQDLRYSYRDPATGLQTSLIMSKNDVFHDRKVFYVYDDLGRLRRARTLTSAAAVPSPDATCATSAGFACYEYSYDAAGNRLSEVVSGSEVTARSAAYAYNTEGPPVKHANQLTSRTGSAGSATYTYDANGNQLNNGAGRALTYNLRDQMTKVTLGSAATSFGYLGAGQDQLVSFGGTTFENGFFGIRNMVQAGVTTRFVYTAEGDLVSQQTLGSGGHRNFVLPDAQGSVVGLMDSLTSPPDVTVPTRTTTYEPYGATESTSGTITSVLGYAGGPTVPGGLLHFGQRYYDPTDGRWTQQDPLMQPVDLYGANRYGYVGGDPVNGSDPSGLVDLNPVHALKSLGIKGFLVRFALPYCVVKGAIKTVRTREYQRGAALSETEARKLLDRNLVGCVPYVGTYADDLLSLVDKVY